MTSGANYSSIKREDIAKKYGVSGMQTEGEVFQRLYYLYMFNLVNLLVNSNFGVNVLGNPIQSSISLVSQLKFTICITISYVKFFGPNLHCFMNSSESMKYTLIVLGVQSSGRVSTTGPRSITSSLESTKPKISVKKAN